MKRTIIISLLCLLCGGAMQAQKIRIKTGIEVLKEQNFRCLEGKRVGLITNPTGVDNRMRSTIDILHEAPNVNLVALYGPEHGVRGDVHAGDHVTDIRICRNTLWHLIQFCFHIYCRYHASLNLFHSFL